MDLLNDIYTYIYNPKNFISGLFVAEENFQSLNRMNSCFAPYFGKFSRLRIVLFQRVFSSVE